MATIGYLASTIVMGVLLGATYLYASRSRTWRSPRLAPETRAHATGDRPGGSGSAPVGRGEWIAGFLLLALSIGVGAMLFVGGGSPSAADAAGIVAVVVFLAALVGFLVLGLYRSAQSWGLHGAQAAAVGAWAGGVLLILAIVVLLLTAG